MPVAIDSLEFTMVNDGSAPLDAVVAVLPLPYFWLHTIKARLELGGLLADGSVAIFDGNPTVGNHEAILYDSGVVTWTPSANDTSVDDALVPVMPVTANFAIDPFTGERVKGAILLVVPTVATGAWTVNIRLTISRE